MKHVFALLVALVSLSGCLNEMDYAQHAIDPSWIIGSWYESYDIYPHFSSDTGSIYTFNEDGSYLLETYDFEAGRFSYNHNYTISKGVITSITPYGTRDTGKRKARCGLPSFSIESTQTKNAASR